MRKKKAGHPVKPADSQPPASPPPAERLSTTTIVEHRSQWVGPLPHPDALRAYGEIVDNGIERIVTMTEKQQQHTIDCERKLVDAKIADVARGQYLGMAVVVAGMAGCLASVYMQANPWVSGLFLGLPVMAVAVRFVSGRIRNSKK